MTNDFIPSLLTIRNQIKIFHWQTESYAEHKAFDFAYDELGDPIDSFIETYQGKYQTRNKSGGFKFELKDYTSLEDAVKEITAYVMYLEDAVPKQLGKKDTELLNLRDEMLGILNQTLFLLSLS